MPSRTRPQESHTPQVDLKFSIPAGKDNLPLLVAGHLFGQHLEKLTHFVSVEQRRTVVLPLVEFARFPGQILVKEELSQRDAGLNNFRIFAVRLGEGAREEEIG